MKIVPEKSEAIFREKSLTWSFRWAMSRGMGCNMWMPLQPSTSDDIHANWLGYWVRLWLVNVLLCLRFDVTRWQEKYAKAYHRQQCTFDIWSDANLWHLRQPHLQLKVFKQVDDVERKPGEDKDEKHCHQDPTSTPIPRTLGSTSEKQKGDWQIISGSELEVKTLRKEPWNISKILKNVFHSHFAMGLLWETMPCPRCCSLLMILR